MLHLKVHLRFHFMERLNLDKKLKKKMHLMKDINFRVYGFVSGEIGLCFGSMGLPQRYSSTSE